MGTEYLCVIFGGALGSMARFGMGAALAFLTGTTFPWGTLFINIFGSFAIGAFSRLPDGASGSSSDVVTFCMVGICGGFTTFSSFSLQTLDLVCSGELLRASTYILLSIILCLVFVRIGASL